MSSLHVLIFYYYIICMAMLIPANSAISHIGDDSPLQALNFAGPGTNYVPLHGACKYRKEEAADYMLRIDGKPTEKKLVNVATRFLDRVKLRGGEICDITQGLRCQHRVIIVKTEVDTKALIRRKNDDIDPDGGGIAVSGFDNIQAIIQERKPFQVLSTCRCSSADAREFAGECLVRAGLPCKFAAMLPTRKCVQNADCIGGIENLDAEFEGFSMSQSYFKLFSNLAIQTCQCLYGYTRSSGRDCLKDVTVMKRPDKIMVIFGIFVALTGVFGCI